MGTNLLIGWNPSAEEQQIIKEAWPSGLRLIFPKTLNENELDAAIRETEIVVGDISKANLLKADRLRFIHVLGHGIDGPYQHRELLKQRGIRVARANPASINIAEFIVMCMVALSRRLIKMHEALVFEGSWSGARKADRMKGSLGGELFGSSLGLIGYGDIGRETARRAAAFGMTVGALVRNPKKIEGDACLSFSAPADRIDDFLGRCDYVVLCAPLSDSTRHLMNADRFGSMKNGSYFINISRGPLVVEEALWEALRSGKLAGAASDVWCAEERKGDPPSYPLDRPIHHYNVIMTPHYSGATRQSRERALKNAGENIRRYLAGEPILNAADLDSGY